MSRYIIPVKETQIELVISRSRFISTAAYTPTIEAAKAFIAKVRRAYPDASHHVYAFALGYGASVTYGMSNAGEPSGTAGKPTLAVVKGCGMGDVTVVTTRYFGGIKLGTGGLVKAYTEAAQIVLAETPRVEKVEKRAIDITTPYNLYEAVIRLVKQHHGQVTSEDFGVEVTLNLTFPTPNLPDFAADLAEITSGQITLANDK
ncbi:MAG TPA: YigZ family protein [Chloroflexi bacterium]|nr:YigZ family protein [Chloroflexota bacterium]